MKTFPPETRGVVLAESLRGKLEAIAKPGIRDDSGMWLFGLRVRYSHVLPPNIIAVEDQHGNVIGLITGIEW